MDYCTLWSFLALSGVSPHSLLLYGKDHCKHIKEVIHTGFNNKQMIHLLHFHFCINYSFKSHANLLNFSLPTNQHIGFLPHCLLLACSIAAGRSAGQQRWGTPCVLPGCYKQTHTHIVHFPWLHHFLKLKAGFTHSLFGKTPCLNQTCAACRDMTKLDNN